VFRAFLVIGIGIDLLIAVFLVIVFGWILDSWHDPREPWAGPIVTTLWSIAFLLSAGAPVLAYWLKRRQAALARIALAVWLPAIVLIAICAAGLILSPP
jgi:biotin transporter BioY